MTFGNGPISGWLYPVLASVSGAITALSFRAFKDMTRGEIALALFVGASFAIFMGPWATHLAFGTGPIDLKLQGALYYLLASGSNILIPLAIRKVRSLTGLKEDGP